MLDQLLNEIETAKASLQEWQRKEKEAHEQILLGRGYVQAMVRALEMAQSRPVAIVDEMADQKEPTSMESGGS